MTIAEAFAWAASMLAQSPERRVSSRADASLLLRYVLQVESAELFAHDERILSPSQLEQFHSAIHQRLHSKPIQYITGHQEFFGLPFLVTPDVLIPRPETEHLVEAAIARLQHHPAPRIVDVGTGSGAIAVALAHALPNAHIVALDICPAALTIAEQNARRNNVADRIQFLQSDLLAAVVQESFDAVVSNPPYIALAERASLPTEVRDHEPSLALFAGPTGLEIYKRLIAEVQQVLAPNGLLLLEIGHRQQSTITLLFESWNDLEFINDLQHIPRVAIARNPQSSVS